MNADLTFYLLVIFQIKHFVADYPLQTPYMLGKFKNGKDWVLPLLAHACVHGACTFVIAAIYSNLKLALCLAGIDLVAHFVMDRIKASSKLLGRFKALSAREMGVIKRGPSIPSQILPFQEALKSNTYFWWSLGVDQMVHHLTHYYIIWRILIGH